MFCPKCRSEYEPQVTVCADCGVPLVASLGDPGPDTADLDLVPVFTQVDPALVGLAESMLAEAGVPYLAQGDGIQDLFGLGRIGHYNPVIGPVVLMVRRQDLDVAREALADLLASSSD